MTAETRHKEGEGIHWSLLLSPIMGLLYVVALPFIAIGAVAAMAGKWALEAAATVAGSLISFGWRPLEAHLAGKKKGKKK